MPIAHYCRRQHDSFITETRCMFGHYTYHDADVDVCHYFAAAIAIFFFITLVAYFLLPFAAVFRYYAMLPVVSCRYFAVFRRLMLPLFSLADASNSINTCCAMPDITTLFTLTMMLYATYDIAIETYDMALFSYCCHAIIFDACH